MFLGVLTQIKIGHDNRGFGASWFLDQVEVENLENGNSWLFPCERWLATDEDDGSIERILLPKQKCMHELYTKSLESQ